MSKTITAVNAKYSLAVPPVFAVPQTLQGYSADTMFTTEALENVELVQGVDGELSGGFVYNPVPQTIEIMPDSDSLDLFEQWYNYQLATHETAIASGAIVIPSIGKSYTMQKGFLSSYMPIVDAKKVLQAVRIRITWKRIIVAPV
jgi:hypothetical protein